MKCKTCNEEMVQSGHSKEDGLITYYKCYKCSMLVKEMKPFNDDLVLLYIIGSVMFLVSFIFIFAFLWVALL